MWVRDLYGSAGAESPCNSLSQGRLGLDSEKTRRRLSKQSPFFAFLQGNWLLNFVPCCWNHAPALGTGAKEALSVIPELCR